MYICSGKVFRSFFSYLRAASASRSSSLSSTDSCIRGQKSGLSVWCFPGFPARPCNPETGLRFGVNQAQVACRAEC